MTQISDIIAQRALDFISACENAGLTYPQSLEVIEKSRKELFENHAFQAHCNRQQIINRVSAACERLRRGESAEHVEGEVNG